MDELHLRLKLALEGDVKASFRNQPVTLRQAALEIKTEGDRATEVQLSAQLDPLAAMRLAGLVAGIKERPKGTASYTFTMTSEALAAHAEAFGKAESLEDWLSAGKGACLKLENYRIESVVTGTSEETFTEEFEIELEQEA